MKKSLDIPPAPIPLASNLVHPPMYDAYYASSPWPINQSGITPACSTATTQNRDYLGYPTLSALMNMDDDLMLFRRFGSLSVRTLLYLQDDIVRLEKDLKNIEQQQIMQKQNTGDRSLDSKQKTDILIRLRSLLKEYGM